MAGHCVVGIDVYICAGVRQASASACKQVGGL